MVVLGLKVLCTLILLKMWIDSVLAFARELTCAAALLKSDQFNC